MTGSSLEEARYSIAMSWSHWPTFLNKTPDAIREFKTLRQQQEAAGSTEPGHASTYLMLSMLEQRQGNFEAARESLDAGLAIFPEDEELKKARESMGR